MSIHSRQPNILVILADQHRWDCVGFNGNRQVKTPNLDRLALDGVNFPETTCAYPVCTPSRYSFFSGLYAHQHGAYTNHCTLDPAIATFPRLLRNDGYRTTAVGKMHFTPTYLDIGFDEMALCEQDGDGRYDDDYHRDLMAAGLVDAIDLYDQRREYRQRAPQAYWETFGALPSNLPEAWHSTSWIGDRSVSALESWTGEANLLVSSFVKPHHPFDPPQAWVDRYHVDEMKLLPGWLDSVPAHDPVHAYFDNSQLTEATLKRITAHYYATISQIDHQIGRMVETLKQRGLYDNTLIVYASDHGEYLGYHHMLLKQGHPYEPLVKVPLLIKYPGMDGAGESSNMLASLIDIAPTILRQANISAAPGMTGHDLRESTSQREIAFSEHTLAGYVMARTAHHKFIWDADPAKSQFFDLQEDPFELHNRVFDPGIAPIVAEFRGAIAHWMLFESTPVLRLDETAQQIDAANVSEKSNRQMTRNYLDLAVQSHLDERGV